MIMVIDYGRMFKIFLFGIYENLSVNMNVIK